MIMNRTDLISHWLITRPSAIPAAGACSVLVMVIKKIDRPTAIDANTIGELFDANKLIIEYELVSEPR